MLRTTTASIHTHTHTHTHSVWLSPLTLPFTLKPVRGKITADLGHRRPTWPPQRERRGQGTRGGDKEEDKGMRRSGGSEGPWEGRSCPEALVWSQCHARREFLVRGPQKKPVCQQAYRDRRELKETHTDFSLTLINTLISTSDQVTACDSRVLSLWALLAPCFSSRIQL